MSVADDRGQWVVPRIVNGKLLSVDDAIQAWKSGSNPPIGGPFKTVSEADKYSEDFHNAEANRIQKADDFLEGGPPSAPAHQSPNEATLSAWHPTLWQRFRTSGIGRKILGPTPIEQEMIGSGQGGLAGPPQGEHGILPILSQSPLGPGPESKLGKAILAYYIGSYAKSQPQRVKQIYQQLKEGDTRGAYGGMIEDVLGGTMMAGAAHGLYREFVPGTKTATPPKGGQDAIPKRSTEKIPVGQAPGDSGGVGTREVVSHGEEGVPGEEPKPAEAQAVAQETQIPLTDAEKDAKGDHAIGLLATKYGVTKDQIIKAQAAGKAPITADLQSGKKLSATVHLDYSPEDLQRYQELKAKFGELSRSSPGSPEHMATWQVV